MHRHFDRKSIEVHDFPQHFLLLSVLSFFHRLSTHKTKLTIIKALPHSFTFTMSQTPPIFSVDSNSISYISSETEAEALLQQCLTAVDCISLNLEWHPQAGKDQIEVISVTWPLTLTVIHLSRFTNYTTSPFDHPCLPTLGSILASDKIAKFRVNIRGEFAS